MFGNVGGVSAEQIQKRTCQAETSIYMLLNKHLPFVRHIYPVYLVLQLNHTGDCTNNNLTIFLEKWEKGIQKHDFKQYQTNLCGGCLYIPSQRVNIACVEKVTCQGNFSDLSPEALILQWDYVSAPSSSYPRVNKTWILFFCIFSDYSRSWFNCFDRDS